MDCLEAVDSDAIFPLCGAASNCRSTIKETLSVAELLPDLPKACELGKVETLASCTLANAAVLLQFFQNHFCRVYLTK